MNIFIDTAVKGCNIALFDNDKILAQTQEPIERGHAQTIMPLLQDLLSNHGKTPIDINEIYVTVGPGSFTGLRVGLTVAQFIGYTLQKPVHGITTFQAFSCGIESNKDRIVVIETKRADYYVHALNAKHEPLGEPQSIMADDINIADNIIVIGDAVQRLQSEKEFNAESVFLEMINVPAVIKAIQKNELKFQKAEAFYIRDADVSQPKK
jgi:tRNA threonylcarbamoyladenosine biosynthesis protein TsaB